jgi:hypothetical protein
MAACKGNGKDHCCWMAGVPCMFLEKDTVPGRKWACGLRREYGDWDKVIASERYQLNIEPHFGPQGINCKDWPDLDAGQSCNECGWGFDK